MKLQPYQAHLLDAMRYSQVMELPLWERLKIQYPHYTRRKRKRVAELYARFHGGSVAKAKRFSTRQFSARYIRCECPECMPELHGGEP